VGESRWEAKPKGKDTQKQAAQWVVLEAEAWWVTLKSLDLRDKF
jgi:hypothetical protein